MRKITVLVANQPRLMRELVMATLLDQPDLEIVGVLEDEASIIGTVEQSRPDFLIVSLGGSGNGHTSATYCWINFPICGSLRWPRRATTRLFIGRTSTFDRLGSRIRKKAS